MRGQHRRERPSPPEPRHLNLSYSQACERRSSTGDDWKGDDVSPSCKENGLNKVVSIGSSMLRRTARWTHVVLVRCKVVLLQSQRIRQG